MELSSFDIKTIQHQFDSFCKKVLKHEAFNFHKEQKVKIAHEIPLKSLSEQEAAQLNIIEEYFFDNYIFQILEYKIAVKDEQLARALTALPPKKRDIILLSYFFDMTDKEIGTVLNMVRRTVQYQRTSGVAQLKEKLEVNTDEEL